MCLQAEINARACVPQAEINAEALADEEQDDAKTSLMASAGTVELVAKPLLLFSDFDHCDTWMQLWGAQHQPMKLLPSSNASKRVYGCRHPVHGKYANRGRAKKKGSSPQKTKASSSAATCTATTASLAATEVPLLAPPPFPSGETRQLHPTNVLVGCAYLLGGACR